MCERLVSVDAGIESPHKAFDTNSERMADSQQSVYRNRTANLALLPMTSREPKANHVFLAVDVFLAQLSDPAAECPEEPFLIHHACVCRILRAETPRAD